MGLQYLRGGDNILLGGSVATTVGTDDATHPNTNLVDGRNRPARATTGTATWEVTAPSSGVVSVVVVHSHDIDAARTVTIAGDVSGSGQGLAARPNGIPLDIWIPTSLNNSASSVSVAVASNTLELIIAELLAGELNELTNDFAHDTITIGYLPIGKVPPRGVSGSVPGFWRGLIARYLRGSIIVDRSERDVIMEWYESTKDTSLWSAIRPFLGSEEAWVVQFGEEPVFSGVEAGVWRVDILFNEVPRKKWIS